MDYLLLKHAGTIIVSLDAEKAFSEVSKYLALGNHVLILYTSADLVRSFAGAHQQPDVYTYLYLQGYVNPCPCHFLHLSWYFIKTESAYLTQMSAPLQSVFFPV